MCEGVENTRSTREEQIKVEAQYQPLWNPDLKFAVSVPCIPVWMSHRLTAIRVPLKHPGWIIGVNLKPMIVLGKAQAEKRSSGSWANQWLHLLRLLSKLATSSKSVRPCAKQNQGLLAIAHWNMNLTWSWTWICLAIVFNVHIFLLPFFIFLDMVTCYF